MQTATFAGGCFWCLVKPFDTFPGVQTVVSGYSGGHVEHPSYEQVCTNTTGHREAVQVTYDESQISYRDILKVYFMTFDPTDDKGQFYDRGESYTPAIFYHDDQQKSEALEYIRDLDAANIFNDKIKTPVLPYKNFYAAEKEHQYYYKKAPEHYERYQMGSGRKAFIEKHWGNRDER